MRYLTVLALFLSSKLFAFCDKPWSDVDLLPTLHVTHAYQHFDHVKSKSHTFDYHVDSHFLLFSLGGTYSDWCADIDLGIARTSQEGLFFDYAKIIGSKRLLNDIVSDFASVTTGISLQGASAQAVKSLSCSHHGEFECALFMQCGKENSTFSLWSSRWWTAFTATFANRGSPKLEARVAFEKNTPCMGYFCLSVDGALGLGSKNIHSEHHFKGWGSIAHRSIDSSLKWAYKMQSQTELHLEYTRRLFAKNYPEHVNFYRVCLIYPISL